ncbi:hypothetical protein BJ878DRAFT_484323 [Calycina marina]|uniref:Uncharacterized protein n=1 Tax=Calycina marina TaxID=1763456 RepID=A0A9P7YUH4_9HELO|nr:hypothetical protein BJ878DRAFT_484323 [Calycina marina]
MLGRLLVVKYGVIICEDDPYSFHQFPAYKIGQSPDLGRVIRLETFKKVNGTPPVRTTKLTKAQEIILSPFTKWGLDGYVEWLPNLRGQYFARMCWTVRMYSLSA